MARSPFRVMRPFTVSFSGGRTSAYMLWRILDAYDGELPADTHVLFANTGKERDETLDFIHEIETRWGVNVRWLEYDGDNRNRTRNVKEVSYETAHRRDQPGSPFERLIGEAAQLPNPVARTCTVQLKTKTMRRWLESQGWNRDFYRRTAIGIRADEDDRTIGIQADCPQYVTPVFPLVAARITVADVMRFWRKQPFDLRLGQHEGNCDMCFLKSRAKLVRIARDNPGMIDWWLKMERSKEGLTEKPGGAKFREDRTFAEIAEAARQGLLFDDGPDDEVPCACAAGPADWRDDDDD